MGLAQELLEATESEAEGYFNETPFKGLGNQFKYFNEFERNYRGTQKGRMELLRLSPGMTVYDLIVSYDVESPLPRETRVKEKKTNEPVSSYLAHRSLSRLVTIGSIRYEKEENRFSGKVSAEYSELGNDPDMYRGYDIRESFYAKTAKGALETMCDIFFAWMAHPY